jgi:hypothetical protein
MKHLPDKLVLKSNIGMCINNSGLSQIDKIYLQPTYYQELSATRNYVEILVMTTQGILKG